MANWIKFEKLPKYVQEHLIKNNINIPSSGFQWTSKRLSFDNRAKIFVAPLYAPLFFDEIEREIPEKVEKLKEGVKLQWKVNTPSLLKEISENGGPAMGIMRQPLYIFGNILAQVAQRASELHDRELDVLMMRLALYEVSDPNSPNYDPEIVAEYLH